MLEYHRNVSVERKHKTMNFCWAPDSEAGSGGLTTVTGRRGLKLRVRWATSRLPP